MLPYPQITEFNIGPVTLQAWGTMVAVGLVVAILLILFEGKNKGFNRDKLLDIIIIAFAGTFVGARLAYVLMYLDEFRGRGFLEIFKIWNGGMAYYGGFIMALVGVLIYVKIKKLNFWKAADIFAPGLAIGLTIGRIGCHLIRDHIGEITTVPWAASYYGELRHETSLYLVIFNLAIFLFVWFWVRKHKWFDGFVFLGFLILEGFSRLAIDFFRATDIPLADPRYFSTESFKGLTYAQIIGIITITVCTWLIIGFKHRKDLLTQGDKMVR